MVINARAVSVPSINLASVDGTLIDCDVAIVGYGPTGMTLAALLGRLGRRVVILERYTGLYNLPRAACFDDEIMRLFQKLGVAEDVARGAVVQAGYDWINAAGQTLVSFEYDNPAPCGWPALYMMYQPHMEEVLDAHLRALPSVQLFQGVTADALEQSADGVTLHGTDDSGRKLGVNARYVVGADGGNGFVRQALASEASDVLDYGFQENWLVCDFRIKRPVPNLPTFRQVCDPAQPIAIVRIGPDHHRFSFMLNPDDSKQEVTQPDRVWARVSAFISPDDAELIRVANYSFRSRIAKRWRDHRVLLAGDAAHEMPPFLAQGMCSGMRDSHNLAWKLDMVLSGYPEALLDTYQQEREPHVRFITERAIELGRVQTMRDPVKARERDARMLGLRGMDKKPEKLRFPALAGRLIANHGGLFPQEQIRCGQKTGRFDDLTGTGWALITTDQHLLDLLPISLLDFWRSIGGHLAVIGGPDSNAEFQDLQDRYGQWFGQQACSAVVVRPDWHIYGTAASSAELATLLEALAQHLSIEPSVLTQRKTS
jgi:2-polyprenyl-6-methoxyphenol hydroxylase-like FAD-dependent oxidoreductase